MSDRCLGWRMLLSRRADGDLSRYEWEALEDHMAGCRDCRDAARSDRMVHLALTRADFALDQEAGRRLDDHILLALGLPERLTPAARLSRSLREIWARWEAVPNLYLTQIAGGTLAAASLTAIFLLTALHPIENMASATREAHRIAVQHLNEPPVPLESLLDQPSPRAASLWTMPALHRPRAGASTVPASDRPAHSSPTPSDSATPDKHGALPDALVRG
jgi:hypothetical protein